MQVVTCGSTHWFTGPTRADALSILLLCTATVASPWCNVQGWEGFVRALRVSTKLLAGASNKWRMPRVEAKGKAQGKAKRKVKATAKRAAQTKANRQHRPWSRNAWNSGGLRPVLVSSCDQSSSALPSASGRLRVKDRGKRSSMYDFAG